MVMTELKTGAAFDDDCKEAVGLLESRGYIVSSCGQDLFAMLRPEHI